MGIPETLTGVLVLLFAGLPGLAGDRIFRALAGVSWREKEHRFWLRLLLCSVFGLIFYAIVADWFGWPAPAYVIPGTFAEVEEPSSLLVRLSYAYAGHLLVRGSLEPLAPVSQESWTRSKSALLRETPGASSLIRKSRADG